MRPMSAIEAWQHIMDSYYLYNAVLKKYDYSFDAFIPHTDFIIELFNKEKLTDQEIEQYKDRFINHFYNVNKLKRLEPIFNDSLKQKFEQAVNEYLVPLLPSWNAKLPKVMEIRCTYGKGSGYWRPDDDHAWMLFRVSRYSDDPQKVFNIMFHEFVHMLIEDPIIQKYNVPQDLKERIVDMICYEYIKKPIQPMFEKSFANNYITPEVIKTDLPGAVKKMMTDYYAIQSTNQNTDSL